MLVPLTASLYAAGTLTNPESILVDVGTGYYIEVKEQYTNVPYTYLAVAVMFLVRKTSKYGRVLWGLDLCNLT
jgi:hypothetical protein